MTWPRADSSRAKTLSRSGYGSSALTPDLVGACITWGYRDAAGCSLVRHRIDAIGPSWVS